MRNTLIVLAVLIASCTAKTSEQSDEHVHETASPATSDVKPKSPKTEAMAMVGGNHIHIDYSAPSTRGRLIFGGLVAFGEVWSTGAHKATNITFDKSVVINGENVEAGKYGLFTIPNEEEWTIIISKDWDMHLADDYTAENDLLRFNVPVTNLEESVETLKFEVLPKEDNSGEIKISWSTVEVAFDIKNKE